MELASNLVWAAIAIALLIASYVGVRRGVVQLSMPKALVLALALGFILLPAISISDDLLASRQTSLPLSSQTWRMASEGASVGLELLLTGSFFILLLMSFLMDVQADDRDQWGIRPLAGQLARCLRLRPPPYMAS